MVNLFERLNKGQPRQEPILPPAQKLLDWLQHDWTQPTISARDIYRLGPNSIRDRESAIKLAESLIKHGWLVPIETRRANMKKWRITKRPDERGGRRTAAEPR